MSSRVKADLLTTHWMRYEYSKVPPKMMGTFDPEDKWLYFESPSLRWRLMLHLYAVSDLTLSGSNDDLW